MRGAACRHVVPPPTLGERQDRAPAAHNDLHHGLQRSYRDFEQS